MMAGKPEDVEEFMSTLEKPMSFKRGDVVSCEKETRYFGTLYRRTKAGFKVQVPPSYFFDALKLAGLCGMPNLQRFRIQVD